MDGPQPESPAVAPSEAAAAPAQTWQIASHSGTGGLAVRADAEAAARRSQQVDSIHLSAAILASLGFLYASTIPWVFALPDFDSRVAGVWESLRWDPAQPLDPVANVLAFVPVGFLWSAAWIGASRARRRLPLDLMTVAFGCLLLAVLAETLQFWIPLRDPSIRDVLALECGAIVGCGLWLVTGARVTTGLGRFVDRFDRLNGRGAFRTLRRVGWWIAGYLVCVLLGRFASPIRLFLTYRNMSTSLQHLPVSWPALGTPWPRGLWTVLAVAFGVNLILLGVCRIGAEGVRQLRGRDLD
jgi:VanZ family protein